MMSFQRTRCSLLIQGGQNPLINAPPDLRHQLVREQADHIARFLHDPSQPGLAAY